MATMLLLDEPSRRALLAGLFTDDGYPVLAAENDRAALLQSSPNHTISRRWQSLCITGCMPSSEQQAAADQGLLALRAHD